VNPFEQFDARPLIIALAGPNGAGKTTFYEAYLRETRLYFVNADTLARELDLTGYAAAELAGVIRRELLSRQESFIFETVFSDPVHAKLDFLAAAVAAGYTVVLCYIGLAAAKTCEQRIAMRVSQGGHDVPTEKLKSRYTRSLANLREAIQELPHVLVYDNTDLRRPFRKIAVFQGGQATDRARSIPKWFRAVIRPERQLP
jgi:predicted ABC-type ATPase